jgi:hypothetical protein
VFLSSGSCVVRWGLQNELSGAQCLALHFMYYREQAILGLNCLSRAELVDQDSLIVLFIPHVSFFLCGSFCKR